MKAIWNGVTIAESKETKVVEGNYYFPPDAIDLQYFSKSETHSRCPWKGKAHYYHINVNGKINPDAAWYYPETSEKAAQIKGFVAFWKGVEIQK
jgi:uncharacterized protein (DUF427 family)